jgi:HSP20 family protein
MNMMTARWEPALWRQMERFRDEMGNLLERAGNWPLLGATYPPLNVWETDNQFFVEAELPGMKLDDLEILVSEGNQLTLKGTRKPVEVEKAVWHRRERGVGNFDRTITFPVDVNPEGVAARFEQGVLLVTLPKSEKAKPRRIVVKGE